MPSFWKHVNKVIMDSDILIEVLDARHVNETRNLEVEQKVKKAGKILLYVITKCDLVSRIQFTALQPCVRISSKEKLGTTILLKKILALSHGEPVTVGVLGYPNVGKSSLINALAGKSKARTSSESGYTKGLQRIKVNNKITVLDTPGVYAHQEKNESKFGKIGAIDHAKIKDPELAAVQLISDKKQILEKHYGIKSESPEGFLELLAVKYKKMRKGNEPDLEATARLLLKHWQTGKILS